MDNQKLLVLGLDGGSWNLLEPWMREGELPNLSKVKDEGFSGNLQSTYPYVTFPAWKTYSTGKNPAKFDVYYWFDFNKSEGTMDFTNSRDFKSKEIWDYLGKEGLTSGVINMPSTYPLKEIDGFMISGTLASDEGFAYPSSLEKELKNRDYRVNPRAEKKSDKWLDEVQDLVELRTDVALERLEEVDFMHLTFFYTDKVQHNYWDGDESLQMWKEVDKQIGRLLDTETNLIIMSDHGFQELDKFFYINSWLQNEGYLKREEDFGDKAGRVGLNRDMLFEMVKKLGVEDMARKLLPKSLRRRIPREAGVIEEEDVPSKIDFDSSQAFALSEGPLFIIEDNVDDKEALKQELKSKLESLREGTIVEAVFDGDKIYSGEYEDSAPDLFLDQAKGVEIRMDLSEKVIDEECGKSSWIANHRQKGIFAAYGPEFTEGKMDISIYDLLPTILSFYDVKIPADIDGDVISEMLVKDSDAKMDKAVDDLNI